MSTTTTSSPVTRVQRRLWQRWYDLHYRLRGHRRHGRLVVERVDGRPFVVLPTVMNPALCRTGALFARFLDGERCGDRRVAEIGCGSGVVAVTAARWARSVAAVDVNPEAIRCTRINAALHGVADKVRAFEGDLFAPLGSDRFDLLLVNPPFMRGRPATMAERAWFSTDFADRFAVEARERMADGGHGLLFLSTTGRSEPFFAALDRNGYDLRAVYERDGGNERFSIHRFEARR